MYGLVRKIVGEENFSQDDFEIWCYSRDSGSVPPRRPGAVAMIRSVEALAEVVRLANLHGKPLAIRGASSSMCGAPMPVQKDSLMLDLTTLQGIDIDEESMVVTAGAGVTWTQLNKALEEKGWELGLEGPWSAPSATVGGTLAVHAICMGAARYGSLGTQITGLEVVLPDGTPVRTGSGAHTANAMVMRDCNGADLTGLFLGSHGSLGIIARAAFKIYPLSRHLAYGAFSFPSLDRAIDAMHGLARENILYDSRLFVFPVPPEIGGDAGLVYMIKGSRKPWLDDMAETAGDICSRAGGRKVPAFGEEYYRGRNHARVKAFGKAGPGWLEVAGFIPIRRYPQVARRVLAYFEEKDDVLKEFKIRWSLGGLLETRSINIPVALFCNERNRAVWERMLEIWMEVAEVMFSLGVSPYWIGDLHVAVMGRLGPAYDLFRGIKKHLDPKNILNPEML